MKGRAWVFHLARIITFVAFIASLIAYPFLPGSYDGLAVGLSTLAQVFGIVGLVLVPLGLLWLIYEIGAQRRPATQGRGYRFAALALVVASLVVALVALIGAASVGLSLALLTIGIWIALVVWLLPKVRRLKSTTPININPAPLYLILLPTAALLLQLSLAAPLTAASRARAINMSAEMISVIEAYYAEHDSYPSSLLAVWNDYYPMVVGVKQYHYEPIGEAYNLAFEQPRFLLDDIGAREFVVYNPLEEQRMISHNSWILLLNPVQVEAQQGWYTTNDVGSPHWRSFLFD